MVGPVMEPGQTLPGKRDYSEVYAKFPLNYPGEHRIYRLPGRNNENSWGSTGSYFRAKLLIKSSDKEELKPEQGI